jgi:hypothetical protein
MGEEELCKVCVIPQKLQKEEKKREEERKKEK